MSSEDRVVQQGTAAWKRLKQDKNWHDWLAVGEALLIGREVAMRDAGTNRPEGKGYATEFGKWLTINKFDDMAAPERSNLYEVMKNLPEIERWRATLTGSERMSLNHPRSVLRKWKAATAIPEAKGPPKPGLKDAVRDLEEENQQLREHVTELEAGAPKSDPVVAGHDAGVAELEAEIAELKAANAVLRAEPGHAPAPASGDARLICSFCSKANTEVVAMIRGNHAQICDECVELCLPIIAERKAAKSETKTEEAKQGGLQWYEDDENSDNYYSDPNHADPDVECYRIEPEMIERTGGGTDYMVFDPNGSLLAEDKTLDEAKAIAQAHAEDKPLDEIIWEDRGTHWFGKVNRKCSYEVRRSRGRKYHATLDTNLFSGRDISGPCNTIAEAKAAAEAHYAER